MRIFSVTILLSIISIITTLPVYAAGFIYEPVCTGTQTPVPNASGYNSIPLNAKVQFQDAGNVPGNCFGGNNHIYVLSVNGNGVLARNNFDIYYQDNLGNYTKVPTDKKTGFPQLNPDGTLPEPPYHDPLPTFNGSSTYRDASNNVVLVAPDFTTTSTKVEVAGSSITTLKHSDSCGVLALKFPTVPTSLSIDGQAIALNSVTLGGKFWKCKSGNLINSPFNSSVQVIQDGSKFYLMKSPKTSYKVTYTGDLSKTLHYNSCGFVVIKNTASLDITNSSTVNGTQVSSLPVVPEVPSCKKGKVELAQGWNY